MKTWLINAKLVFLYSGISKVVNLIVISVESFKTNMVACVTGFSLLIYVPICIVIWCIDRRRKKKWEKENSVHIRTVSGPPWFVYDTRITLYTSELWVVPLDLFMIQG